MVYGSVIVALVLMPVFFLPGLSGSFFRPLALSYILAILSSLFVAMTLTPALALILLRRARERRESPFLTWLKARYELLLPRLLNRPKQIFLLFAGALAITLGVVPFWGRSFCPISRSMIF